MADALGRGGLLWDGRVMEPEPTPEERELRDKFVHFYLRTRDATRAARLCGFMDAFAPAYGRRLLTEPYVERRLEEIEIEFDSLPKEEQQRIVKAGLFRSAFDESPRSSHSARVSALAKLANILDMDGSKKLEVMHRGGVMLVPAMASVDDWERVASAQQEEIVRDVRH